MNWPRRPALAGLAISILLGACSGDGESGGSEAADRLNVAALEAGALPDQSQIDPAGRYGRRYEGGADSLCLVPDKEERRDHYRFGVETLIGGDEYCRGTGTAKLAGDKLILRFDGRRGLDSAACLIVARYEGDRIAMPGALDISCALQCSRGGSLAAVSFPRIDGDVAAARQMRDGKKDLLCR